MNSVDGGNLIHITHFSSVLPKESRGEQSFTITVFCFDGAGLYILPKNYVTMVLCKKIFIKFKATQTHFNHCLFNITSFFSSFCLAASYRALVVWRQRLWQLFAIQCQDVCD